MNKKILKQTMCCILLCIITTLFFSLQVSAAPAKPSCAKKVNINCYYYSGIGWHIAVPDSFLYIKNLDKAAKITNIKCSNSNLMVKSMLNDKERKMKALQISEKDYNSTFKPGDMAKISFRVKQNGKTYNLSCKIQGRKMPSPFKKFMIGSINYTSSCEGKADFEIGKIKDSTVKIKYTPAKGYKIDSIYASYDNRKSKKVKNGARISTKGLIDLLITYSVKKPANYQKPMKWNWNKTNSPLQDWMIIRISPF